MQDLPLELVDYILALADAYTKPVLRCVSPEWCTLVDSWRRTEKEQRLVWPFEPAHRCFDRKRCALRLARHVADRDRWSIVFWIMKDLSWTHSLYFPVVNRAARLGNWAVVRRIYRTCGPVCTCAAPAYAAAQGRLDVLQWMVAHGMPLSSNTASEAARSGHIHILEWLRAFHCTMLSKSDMSPAAAAGQRMDVLEWLDAHRYPIDQGTLRVAASVGNVEIAKWALTKGCSWDLDVPSAAACNGHTDFLRWAQLSGCPWDGRPFAVAAAYGQLDTFMWIACQTRSLNASVCRDASKGGYLDLLKHAIMVGCHVNQDSCRVAALYGHTATVQWLITEGHCHVSVDVASAAASSGRMDMLEWLHARGCPLDSRVIYHAAHQGRVDMGRWAYARGCPWDSWTIANAVFEGHIDFIRWAIDEAGQTLGPDACVAAARRGHPNLLRWLRARGCPWAADTCLTAAKHDRLSVLQWAVANGCPHDRAKLLKAARAHMSPQVTRWLNTFDS